MEKEMRYFFARSEDQIPANIERFISVDGSVPKAHETWDHHKTGEKINLDAMPGEIDLEGIEAIATTNIDADSIISAVAAVLGGENQIPAKYRPTLRSAAHWCDYLTPDPNISKEENNLGLGLLGNIKNRIFAEMKSIANEKYAGDTRALEAEDSSIIFGNLVTELLASIESAQELPCDFSYLEKIEECKCKLCQLKEDGTSRIKSIDKNLAIVDITGLGYIDPIAQYTLHDSEVQIMIADAPKGQTGFKYTVGCHPNGSQPDLRPLIETLQKAESAKWIIDGEKHPEGSWGGRATVFGSPFYGTKLSTESIKEIVQNFLNSKN